MPSTDTTPVRAAEAVARIKSHEVMPDDRASVRDLVELSRTQSLSLTEAYEELATQGDDNSRLLKHRVYVRLIQYIGSLIPKIREDIFIARDGDGAITCGAKLSSDDLLFSELPPLTDQKSCIKGTTEIRNRMQEYLSHRFGQARDRLPEHLDREDLHEKANNLYINLFGGMADAIVHVGMAASALLAGQKELSHSMLSPDQLKTELVAALPELRRLTELSLFEVMVLDILAYEGYNSFIAIPQSGRKPDECHMRLMIKEEAVSFLESVNQLLNADLSGTTLKCALNVSLPKSAGEFIPGQIENQISDLIYEIRYMIDREPEGQEPQWVNTLGCPATRARVINEWYDLVTDLLVDFYRASNQDTSSGHATFRTREETLAS